MERFDSVAGNQRINKVMDKKELLCRAWIKCDPNRSIDPDSIMEPLYDSDGTVHVTDLTGQPRWKWFEPRAEALERFLNENEYEIVAMKPHT